MGDYLVRTLEPTMFELGTGNDNFYSNGEYAALQMFLKKGDVILDCGAASGNWANSCLSLIIPKMIYCFEPSNTYEQLFKRFHYRISSNMRLYKNAIANVNSKIEFFYYKNYPEMSNFFGRKEVEERLKIEKEKIIVEGIMLDSFIEQEKIERIDYLKLDLEGAEYLALQGCEKSLEKNIINLAQWEGGGCLRDALVKLEDIFRLFGKYGYSVFRIVPDGLIYLDKWYPELENYLHSNYLAFSKRKAEEILINFPTHPMEFENNQKIEIAN